MKIAIITPSRGRPKELFRLFRSAIQTVTEHEIEFRISLDEDDPAIPDYIVELEDMNRITYPKFKIITMVSERRSLAKIWNFHAKETNADYIMMGGDDLVFCTRGWDVMLYTRSKMWLHPYHLIWFNDSINGEKGCSFPIVTKQWIQKLGYFVPEHFNYFFIDTWVWDVAKRAGVAMYAGEVIMQHLHFSAFKDVPFDKTYADNRKNNESALDQAIFDSGMMLNERIAHSEKIIDAIRNFK